MILWISVYGFRSRKYTIFVFSTLHWNSLVLMQGVKLNANELNLFLIFPPLVSPHCKLVSLL